MTCKEKKVFVKNVANIVDVISVVPVYIMLILGQDKGEPENVQNFLSIFSKPAQGTESNWIWRNRDKKGSEVTFSRCSLDVTMNLDAFFNHQPSIIIYFLPKANTITVI